MRPLSEDGHRILSDVAARHGVSSQAVETLFMAIVAGGGMQAQFNHPDLGGMGQWSQGGMIMIGDMFNNGLKARVDWLCQELSGLIRSQDLLAPAPSFQSQQQSGGYQQQQGSGVSLFVSGGNMSSSGWPAELGHPSSVGSQNNLRYAFFPSTHRLVIDINGQQTVYDTGDHQIGGFSQQQSGDQSITFTSQYGLVRVADLPVINPGQQTAPAPSFVAQPEPQFEPQMAEQPVSSPEPIANVAAFEPVATPDPVAEPAFAPSAAFAAAAPSSASASSAVSEEDIFAKIEKLAVLHGKGILTDEEFSSKKADLLGRL
jgi:hypothetical protein